MEAEAELLQAWLLSHVSRPVLVSLQMETFDKNLPAVSLSAEGEMSQWSENQDGSSRGLSLSCLQKWLLRTTVVSQVTSGSTSLKKQ